MKEEKLVLQISCKLLRIVLLLAFNKLRKRKILFRRKMKNVLLTFTLFMQKQDYYCCSGGYVSQVLPNPKTRFPCRYWMIKYEQRWFEKMTARKDEPICQELWNNEFRMLPSTFDFIVNLVEADMRKEDTYFPKTISIQKRVACALWQLSTGNSYRVVSNVFGVGRSTVSQIMKEFCKILCKKSSRFKKFPKTRMEVALEIQKFQDSVNCKIPQTVGGIDGTRIEINSSTGDNKMDYFNRKQRYLISTQAVIGGNLTFLNIATGYPGSIHDARILRDSALYIQTKRNILLTEPTDVIDGYKIKPFLIGDGAYPANTWHVKQFPSNLNLFQEQEKFNRFLSSARVAVEHAFGILKARWRCLLNCLDHNIENLSDVIISCCVLHNICQMKGDSYIDNDDVLEHTLQRERERRTQRREEHKFYASVIRYGTY